MKKSNLPVERAYKDASNIDRVVLIPPGESDMSKGIPVSLDISSLYAHMPDEFQQKFYEALHAQGLVKAQDYFAPDAAQRYKAAVFAVIRSDFLSIQALAKQELDRRK